MSPSKDLPPSKTAAAPKIAIKGFSLSSKTSSSKLSNNNNNNNNAKKTPLGGGGGGSTTLGKRSTFGHDSDSESDGDGAYAGRHEIVTGFAGGEVVRKEERAVQAPLVIPKMGNRVWGRGVGGKGGKNLLPPEVQAEMEGKRREREGVDVVNSKDGEVQWGLSVRKRRRVDDGDGDGDEDVDITADTASVVVAQEVEVEVKEPVKEMTADEEALAALLGEEKERKGPDLVIAPIAESAAARLTEEDAYRLAIASAPDASTLEDYERIPVEEFGAAMLRGMGWKGEANSSDKARNKGKDVKRRQNLLGLGAKELKDAEELGAWVQKSDVKRLRPAGEGSRKPERRPGVAEYQRERDEKRYREGGYRESERRDRERDRERNGHRDRDHRDGFRERELDRDRDHRDRRR